MKTFTLAVITLVLFSSAVHAQSTSGYFITQWNTTLDTTSDGTNIQFLGVGTNYTISIAGLDTAWASEITANGMVNIAVPKAGLYTVMAYSGAGSFDGYANYGGGSGTPQTDSRDMLTKIEQWGSTKFTRLNFNSADNLDITATDIPDLSRMYDLQESFAYCPSLKGNNSIERWKVDSIVIMYKMFQGDVKFNRDLSQWNLAKAVNLGQMFSYSGMSNCNYTKTLNGWAANVATARNVFFSGQDEMTFADSAGRNILIGKGWRILGDLYSTAGSCLPTVEVVAFNNVTGSVSNGQLSVSWNTSTEANSDHFDIEASSDSSTFSVIGSVNSQAVNGNSSQSLHYTFTTPYDHVVQLIGSVGFIGLAFARSFRRRKALPIILVLACISCFATLSCKKTGGSGTTTPADKKIYVRIVQVDKAGTKTYSDIITPARH